MQCSWSEVWVTALIPSNYSSTLLEQKKKKKWRRHFGNIPCDRERELLIREDQGCSVATSLVSWSLSKDRFWTLSNETGWLFCGTGLMGQHPQGLTPFCCNLEPEFSQGQVQSTHSLAAHYRISGRPGKGLTSNMYYCHFSNNWIRLFNILPWA